MASAFNLLTSGGARFDKNRFKKDIDLFTGAKASSSKKVKGKGKERATEPDTLPSSLNLFHASQPPSKSKSKSRSKPEPESDDEEDIDSDESDDSSSSSSNDIPAPPKQKITITGSEPLPKSLHANLPSLVTNLPSTSGQPLLNALKESNIHSLWGVQCAVGGSLLEGRDVICVAPTGSGKTLAYVLPTLVRLGDPARSLSSGSSSASEKNASEKTGKGKTGKGSSSRNENNDDQMEQNEGGQGIRALIVVPTHDLAVQIEGVVKAVTRKRGWRCLVLSKATEKAICESSPGASEPVNEDDEALAESGEKNEDGDGDEALAESGEKDEDGEGDEEKDEDEEEEEEREEEKERKKGKAKKEVKGKGKQSGKKDNGGRLGIDILISTPERLHHLLEEGKISLASTRHLILDESDRLLSSDFLPQIQPIVEACTHPEIQKCFLSATMPAGPEAIASKWLNEGVRVVVGLKDSAVSTISQSLLYTASESGKTLALSNLIAQGDLPYPSLIFTQSIERADELSAHLKMEGIRVGLVHGKITPARRDEAVEKFRSGEVWVLVVTEVLARGMDFRGVKVVVNYDFPQTVQSYIHRIGRTGRAGRPGKAITFFSNEDAPYLKTIANVLTASGCPVPSYMLNLPNPSKNTKKNIARAPPKRKAVGGGGRDVGKEEGRRFRGMVEGSRKRGKGDGDVDVDMDE